MNCMRSRFILSFSVVFRVCVIFIVCPVYKKSFSSLSWMHHLLVLASLFEFFLSISHFKPSLWLSANVKCSPLCTSNPVQFAPSFRSQIHMMERCELHRMRFGCQDQQCWWCQRLVFVVGSWWSWLEGFQFVEERHRSRNHRATLRERSARRLSASF